MDMRDIVRLLLRRSGPSGGGIVEKGVEFAASFDSDGANFVIARGDLGRIDAGHGGVTATTQLILLRMLEEQGLATAMAGGFHVPSESAVLLEDAFAHLLRMPEGFRGSFRAHVSGHTNSVGFAVRLVADSDRGERPVTRRGPVLRFDGREYLATPAQLRALQAVEAHTKLATPDRTELANARLVAQLQSAATEGMDVDLAYFSRGGWSTSEASRVGVVGTTTADGGLILSPSLNVDVDPAKLESRWSQVADSKRGGVLRVGKNLVLLDPDVVDAVHEVLQNRTISPEHVAEFLKTPSAFLDARLVDLDLGFSVRVTGIGKLAHFDFGEAAPTNLDWFATTEALNPSVLAQLIMTTDDLERFQREYSSAVVHQAETLRFDGELIDIREPLEVSAALEGVVDRITRAADIEPDTPTTKNVITDRGKFEKVGFILQEAEQVVERLHHLAAEAQRSPMFDPTLLARQPFPHQRAGIDWMSSLMAAAHDEDADQLYRLQGALLADDMGLGKTFMALVAIQQHIAHVATQEGVGKVKPTMVVAPLSLIENWEEELEKTFTTSPFSDVVVLQSGRDLPAFRVRGAGREANQLESALDAAGMIADGQLRIALKVGPDAGSGRLDLPGRLVLTTYETLRDYQFSLSQVDWGVVVFDEAQTIKNPDAIRTRAAKALKADFKLLATGTPVENSLGEFWCLIDTAQPGLLGDWHAFRERFLLPLTQAEPDDIQELRLSLGSELREAVGSFMLRREKADHIEGLPEKITHTGLSGSGPNIVEDPTLARMMPLHQSEKYDAHLERMRAAKYDSDPKVAALSILQSLRLVSLHPDLDVHGVRPPFPTDREHALQQLAESAKLAATIDTLRHIRERGEKVIIFAISKDLQMLLALWLQYEFAIRPEIVNGDTSAISSGKGASRRQLIRSFEEADGFNVIVMSPIAAGVGLTVVGANHVIHLERHWNPAKEAQATDRVYRIGQTRDVHIYYPAARHPRLDSFDVLIDRLLSSKVNVKDSVLVPTLVSEQEIAEIMAGLID